MYRRPTPLAHCGRCVACLLRRSGLLAATGDDRTLYENDLTKIITDNSKGIDYWALRHWLHEPFTSADLIKDVPLPADAPLSRMMPVLTRGRQELLAMVNVLTPEAMPRTSRQSDR